MSKVDGNRLAQLVTKQEGGKVSVSIGQVKEVQKLTFLNLMAHHTPAEILTYLEKRYGTAK